MPKATSAEVSQRVEEVLRIRLDGAQFHDIVQYASERAWGVSERQLWNYVRKADELLAARRDKRRGRTLALHFARREALYARAVNAADYRTALAVLSDLAKLGGLYPPAPKPKDEGPNVFGDLLRDAIRARIEAPDPVGDSGPTGHLPAATA